MSVPFNSSADHDYVQTGYFENYRLRLQPEARLSSTILPSFLIKYKNPERFLPLSHEKHFNEKIFYNTLHRECFNSCIDTSNTEQCYSNCQSKHLTSVELLKNAVVEDRKYNGVTNYINLREYQKRPNEMGKNIVSDVNFAKKQEYLEEKFKQKVNTEVKTLETGFVDFFNKTYNTAKITTNIFDIYLRGQFPSYINKALKRNDVCSRYAEYKELNEKYGSQISDILESEIKDELTWGHINGEDYE